MRSPGGPGGPEHTADGTGSTPAVDPVSARGRRRFARRQWARRWLVWRYVLVAVLFLLLVVSGLWLVFFSSVLAVEAVDVEGNRTLGAADVREAAAVPTGEPLARLDLDAIRARVQALAVVRSAEVTRLWPDQVLISVEERVAIAVVDIGGRLRGMDAEGVVFRDYARAPAGLPRVETSPETGGEALREAAEVVAALPTDLAGRVDHLTVESVDRIELVLRDGRTVMWGSAEDSEQKAAVLARLLELPGLRFDVSVPGNPTTSG